MVIPYIIINNYEVIIIPYINYDVPFFFYINYDVPFFFFIEKCYIYNTVIINLKWQVVTDCNW